MLPPSFPNAAAHFLSLVLVGAELVLVGINLVLFALVHLAVWLNKYITPHWFHQTRARLAETVSGVVDHAGRATAVAAKERRDAVSKLENATTYDEYVTYATLLDAFPADLGEGGQAWRDDAEGGASGDAYDDALVRMYESVCRAARLERDANALGLALRTVLHRNFAGVDRVSRLKNARFGTKRSAEAFVAELSRSVAFLGAVGEDEKVDACQKDDDPDRSRLRLLERVSAEVKDTLRLVSETHRSLGRTALCLSGGGALAMYHFGVIKTLLEQGLLPQVISGTSGGSIVAAFVSMFPEEELLKTIRSDLSSRHGVRWFPPPWKMALHFAKKGTLMDGAEFAATTKKYFGDVTFAEAFAISKRAVSIQVSVGSGHGFVLNHFTAPQVVVRTAVNASCALPGLMEPFPLLAKNPKTSCLNAVSPPRRLFLRRHHHRRHPERSSDGVVQLQQLHREPSEPARQLRAAPRRGGPRTRGLRARALGRPPRRRHETAPRRQLFALEHQVRRAEAVGGGFAEPADGAHVAGHISAGFPRARHGAPRAAFARLPKRLATSQRGGHGGFRARRRTRDVAARRGHPREHGGGDRADRGGHRAARARARD
jgi:hypothetical protein